MTNAQHSRAHKLWLCALGALIGCYGTLCGIGGGLFAVPLLHYAYQMPLKIAVANSLVLVAASTSAATLLEVLHPRAAIDWGVTAALLASSFVGARIGFFAAKRIDVRALKLMFCVLLAGVATQILIQHGAQGASADGAAELVMTSTSWVIVLAIGFVAGFVAPLLGIGGGIVAVPGLLYGVPSLGYLGARACSMAMSMLTSWQSVWLYRKDGALRTTTSIWLAIGAIAGAAAGVQLVHVPSITRIAQWLVAFALYFAAARFAWDLRQRGVTAASR